MKNHSLRSPRLKKSRYLRLAASAAIVAGMMSSAYFVYGHGENSFDHDLLLESIPGGTVTLLPDDTKNPILHGTIGPLLPMHTMSVHNTLTWKKDQKMPLMLMFHRHSAYTADEVAEPNIIDFLIKNPHPTLGTNAFGNQGNQFNSSMRRTFQQYAYGGYNIIHDVSQSVPTRMGLDQTRELTQLWDMNKPTAFDHDYSSPPFSAAALTNKDLALNIDAFRDTGRSRGLFYDMYCPGFSTLEDGRPVFMGGHDMNSQNGNYRIQVYDPETEGWATRPESCMRKYFGKHAEAQAFRVANGLLADDFYLEKHYKARMDEIQAAHVADTANNPSGTPYTTSEIRVLMADDYLPGCDPHELTAVAGVDYSSTYREIRLAGVNGTITHPLKLSSDMKYARWYPGQITLPGNKIFVYAGWDRDEFNPAAWPTNANGTPNTTPTASTTAMDPFINAPAGTFPDLPANAALCGYMKSGGDAAFLGTRVKQVVPEVYDGNTDQMTSLENAPLFHNAWYPNGTVVQTGPGRNDWKVAVNDADLLGNVPSAVSATRGNGLNVGAYKPMSTGATQVLNRHYHNTWLLDVQAALKDPNHAVDQPESINESKTSTYWTKIAESVSSHSEFTGNANIMELDKFGRVISHKLTHFGGEYQVSSSPLKVAALKDATEVETTALLVSKGPYNMDTTALREVVTVIAINSVDTDSDGTPDKFTATLSKPLLANHAAGSAFTINGTSKNVEEIDFAPLFKKPKPGQPQVLPTWKVVGELYQPGRQNYATPLPDGTIMLLGGNGGTLPNIERWSLHTQLYTPGKEYDPANPTVKNSMRRMAKSLIPRDEHGIIQLMPDGQVYLGGQNRNGMVVLGDPIAPLGDSDLGVPCGQLFRPPYLYDYTGNPAQRPSIVKIPSTISYGKPFVMDVFSFKKIKNVSFIRAGAMSHSLNTDVRLVKLAFKQKGNKVTVFPPTLPGTAIGGYYQVFIVDEGGVPSVSAKVILGTAVAKRRGADGQLIGKPVAPFTNSAQATPLAGVE